MDFYYVEFSNVIRQHRKPNGFDAALSFIKIEIMGFVPVRGDLS